VDTAQNERAVNALLDGVLSSYNIDRKKVVVTGFSSGRRRYLALWQ
jgi:predicted peptidase